MTSHGGQGEQRPWESKRQPPDPLRGDSKLAGSLGGFWSAVRVWIMAVARGVYESTKADYSPLVRLGDRFTGNSFPLKVFTPRPPSNVLEMRTFPSWPL